MEKMSYGHSVKITFRSYNIIGFYPVFISFIFVKESLLNLQMTTMCALRGDASGTHQIISLESKKSQMH